MKKVLLFSLSCVLLLGSIMTTYAEQNNSEELLIDQEDFRRNATMNETLLSDGSYEIVLTQELDFPVTRSSAEEQHHKQNIVKIIAFDEDTASAIKNAVRSPGGSNMTHDSYLGDSFYAQIQLDYSSKSAGIATLYRVDNVVITTSVNSGTTITAKEFRYSCIGAEEGGASYYKEDSINIKNASNPYTTTIMSAFPYVYNPGTGHLGVSLHFTVKRPSGQTLTDALTNNLFLS